MTPHNELSPLPPVALLNIKQNGSHHSNGDASRTDSARADSSVIHQSAAQTSPDLAVILSSLAPHLKAVETEIERLISTPIKLITDVASHTLGAGGKRVRPAMTILAAQLCGDDPAQANAKVVSCAAAIELTHTTTLLHDDVVDAAEVRRGKPAANMVWGNGMSVLVGDYLFAKVFLITSQEDFAHLMHPLADATGKMCEGELLEVQRHGALEMSEAEYEEVIAMKTAALTECAMQIGAMAVKADDWKVQQLARYGYYVGMAFQVVDDIFDVVSSKHRIGKPVGNDIREGAVTLPMLRAMQVLSSGEKDELRHLIGKTPISDEEVQRALDILRGCDAVDYSMNIARVYIAQAKAQLDDFPDSPARTMLYEIADYVLTRDK